MIINYSVLIKAIYDKCQEAIISGEEWTFMENKTTFAVFKSHLQEAFNATLIDFGGHNHNNMAGDTLSVVESKEPHMYEKIKERTTQALKYFVRDVYKAIKENLPYEDIEKSVISKPSYFYTTPMLIQGSPGTYCFVCGKTNGLYMKNGVVSPGCFIDKSSQLWELLHDDYKIMLREEGVSEDKLCAYPDGIEKFEQFMTIKSNYLVFANDLRSDVKIDPIKSLNYVIERSGYYNTINSDLGGMYDQEYALSLGLIKVQTGNSSPVVAYNSKTGAILAADQHSWKQKKQYQFPLDIEGFRAKCTICTDVWTVQAVDSIIYEDYAKEQGISLKEAAERNGHIIPVTPGKYKITTYTAPPVFFTIEKVD